MPQTVRESLDARVMEALSDQELTMGELVKKLSDSSYSVRDIKTRVLQLIPQKIELTRKLGLKLTHFSQ